MYIEQKQGYGKKMDHQIPVSRTMGIVTHQVLLTRMNTQVINFPFIALFYDISPSSFLLFICAPLFQFLFYCSQEKMPTQISHKSSLMFFLVIFWQLILCTLLKKIAIISLAYELRIDITPDMGSIKLFAVVDLGFVFFYIISWETLVGAPMSSSGIFLAAERLMKERKRILQFQTNQNKSLCRFDKQ